MDKQIAATVAILSRAAYPITRDEAWAIIKTLEHEAIAYTDHGKIVERLVRELRAWLEDA